MFVKFFLLAIVGFTTTLAFADQMGPGGDKFYEEAARFETACKDKDICDAPYTKKVIYDYSRRYDKLETAVKAELKQIAFNQAQIWGDTILEGDYHAAGRTRLDTVIGYYNRGQIVGYKIQYSEKAWFVGQCNYDGSHSSLKDCTVGRILEVSYVSPDMQTYFSDEDRYASFQSQTL